MNLELLESFGQNYPEESDGTLDTGSMAVTCAFNRHGTLLAVGCNDGRIVVWDFLTRGIAKVYNAHVHPVCSIGWSRNGRKLLSAATDNLVCVWDVLSGECLHTYRFPSPIMQVKYAPRDENMILICPLKHSPLLLNSTTGEHTILPLLDETDMNIVTAFDRRGEHIFTGNSKGRIAVIAMDTKKIVASFRTVTGSSNAAIKQIEFSKKGTTFLVNTSDRIIRVYDSKEVLMMGKDSEPEAIQRLQDLVNKTPWRKCCFSGDGEYICAGSAKQHQLYIWEKSVGNLVKILQGTRGEQLLDVVWHPLRPILCSISSGIVSVWSQNQVENWSAFAPDFSELDENVEYDERESEFDEEDEDRSIDNKDSKKDEEDTLIVDVTTMEPIRAFMSSDEEDAEDCLEYLPISPEVDDPEENVLLPPKDPTNPTQPLKTSPEPPVKKQKVVDISLDGAIGDEEHPLLSGSNRVQKNKKKHASNKSTNKTAKSAKLSKTPKISSREGKPLEMGDACNVLNMGSTIDDL